METIKQCKLAVFSDTESAHEGTSNQNATSFDAAANEMIIELGRCLYKLMFQLILLIECNHKISINIINNLQQNEKMEDLSKSLTSVRGCLLRCIDDAETDSLDTSTSTEGDITPTPSPSLPMTGTDFECHLFDLIDNQKWSTALAHLRHHKKMTGLSAIQISTLLGAPATLNAVYTINEDTSETIDDLSIVLNIYAQRLIKDKNGNTYFKKHSKYNVVNDFVVLISDVFMASRTEAELIETQEMLMENVYRVAGSLT